MVCSRKINVNNGIIILGNWRINLFAVFKREILRRIYRPYVNDHVGVWRKRHNKELEELV